MRILVTGAGGFVGTHLVERLKEQGHWVRGVDIKRPEWSESPADEFWLLDLRDAHNALDACRGVERVYHLAADMGGMGYISHAHAEIIRNNTMINENVITAAYEMGVRRFLFSSSACVYNEFLQQNEGTSRPLKEEDAYPAYPQDAYGWEKLHMEHMCRYYADAGWLDVRVVRFHNVYAERGSWNDGREKAPAALCRKVAVARLTDDPAIEIWGDGEQVRSFMYISDCLEGLMRLMDSSHGEPLNLGRDRAVTINQLADIIADIAGITIEKKHIPGPQGVRWRNSDNSKCAQVLGWTPSIPLEKGLIPTYHWIERQVADALEGGKAL